MWNYLVEKFTNLIRWFDGEDEPREVYIVFGPINVAGNDGIHGIFYSEVAACRFANKLRKTGALEPIYISNALSILDS